MYEGKHVACMALIHSLTLDVPTCLLPRNTQLASTEMTIITAHDF